MFLPRVSQDQETLSRRALLIVTDNTKQKRWNRWIGWPLL